MDTEEQVIYDLETAITHLTEKGWWQGNYYANQNFPSETPMCATGAIVFGQCVSQDELVDGYPLHFIRAVPTLLSVTEVIQERYPHLHAKPYDAPDAIIVRWNDEDERTVEEVIEVFQETIKRVRENGLP